MSVLAADDAQRDRLAHLAKEYEDFAYIVSHDLNAPLRHVREFARLLIDCRDQPLSADEQNYVAYLNQALAKMDEMQKALLTFSRINTQAGDMVKADSNLIVSDVLRQLGNLISGHATTIDRAPLPTVVADPKQFHLLLRHVIENAVKFHDPQTPRRAIAISGAETDTRWSIAVRDNGIGIAPKFHQKMFRMFWCLHPDEYFGAGAGLAFADRIARRHGGSIAVDSELGQGTTITVTLPKR